jgi:hypothetical protein
MSSPCTLAPCLELRIDAITVPLLRDVVTVFFDDDDPGLRPTCSVAWARLAAVLRTEPFPSSVWVKGSEWMVSRSAKAVLRMLPRASSPKTKTWESRLLMAGWEKGLVGPPWLDVVDRLRGGVLFWRTVFVWVSLCLEDRGDSMTGCSLID